MIETDVQAQHDGQNAWDDNGNPKDNGNQQDNKEETRLSFIHLRH